MASPHSERYFAVAAELARAVEAGEIDAIVRGLAAVRERGGRLFVLGVGGGAGHASHAVNDFRKLCGIESYAPTDNVSELTARTNDDGWETSFSAWLEVSRLGPDDALLVFSVGGGSREHNVSVNLVSAIELARRGRGARSTASSAAPVERLAELADVADPHRASRRPAHTARRVLPGGRLARARLPSGARGPASALGVGRVVRERGPRFLDRDGVLNELVRDPDSRCPSRRSIRRRSCSCLVRLTASGGSRGAGYLLVGVSNQPAAAKGTVSAADARSGPGAGSRPASPRGRSSSTASGSASTIRRASCPTWRGRATAASPRRACCSTPPASSISTSRSCWMIGDTDADVAAGPPPGAGRCSSRTRAAPTSEAASPGRTCARRISATPPSAVLVCRDALELPTVVAFAISVKVFADGADLDAILALAAEPADRGLHDEPDADVEGRPDGLRASSRSACSSAITDHPISFEVFADDADEMRAPGAADRLLGRERLREDPGHDDDAASRLAPLVRELSEDGVKVNVTALFTTAQVELITAAVRDGAPSYHLGLRRPHRRRGHRPGADHGAGRWTSWSRRRARS